MSTPPKLQVIQPGFVRVTRPGHGAPLYDLPPRRKTIVGNAPTPTPTPTPRSQETPPASQEPASPFLLLRRREDDAFSSRPTNKLPDARLVPPAARAAFAATWGVTLQGPETPRVDGVAPSSVEAAPDPRGTSRGLAARVKALLLRVWRRLRMV